MPGPAPAPSLTPASVADTSGAVLHVPPVIRRVGEGVLIAILVASPWLYAGAEPAFEFLLAAGVVLLASLWALHVGFSGRLAIRADVVTLALAGLVVWTAVQLVPLPSAIVGTLSPQRLAWHLEYVPAVGEVLPGESGPGNPRPDWLPLTTAPAATRLFLARVLGLLVFYAVVRNWLATREALTRVAWALTINGGVLAFLAIGALFAGPKDAVLWVFPVAEGGPYGTFVCRNHYPDYIAVCLGLAVGLLLTKPAATKSGRSVPTDWLSVRSLGLVAAVAFMVVSVPFSLSRGGTLALLGAGAAGWLLTRWPTARSDGADETAGGAGRLALAGAAGVVLLLIAWLGTGLVEARLGSLAGSQGLDSRLPLWRDALKLVPGFWLTGTGAGTFGTTEPTVRADGGGANVFYANAHNDYLEALTEGGIVRLTLTLVLAGVVVAAARGYLVRRERSVGPKLLGLTFALAAIAAHAAGDFALHMPAVALAAAAAAGFALAAAADPEFAPARVKVRKVRAGDAPAPAPVATDAPAPSSRPVRGPLAGLLGCGLAAAALFVALEIRRTARAEALKVEAEAAFWRPSDPDRLARRADLYAARAELIPDDAVLQYDAGQAHLDAAVRRTWTTVGGVVGGGLSYARPPARFTPDAVAAHVAPAAGYFRRARTADPLFARAHGRLGVCAPYLTNSETAAVHLGRAKRLLPADEDVWYAAGREAFARGDHAQAVADWQHSLRLSRRHLLSVLAAARGVVPPDRVRDELLPADPVTLLAAVDVVHPDPDADAGGRRPYLDRVLAVVAAKGANVSADDRAAEAAAFDELARPTDAETAWKRAIDLAPERNDLRDGYSRWLEREERYDEAIEQIEWLRRRLPSGAYQDRYDGCKHARKLAREIRGE